MLTTLCPQPSSPLSPHRPRRFQRRVRPFPRFSLMLGVLADGLTGIPEDLLGSGTGYTTRFLINI